MTALCLPALVVAALLLTGCVGVDEAGTSSSAREAVTTEAPAATAPVVTAGPSVVPAAEVLRRWDAARAQAYADGDLAVLRQLYVRGAAVGRADVAMLRGYAVRGLRVRGMTMQLLALTVVAQDRARLVLRVTDRLTGAFVVSAGGEARALPRDRASTRLVTLRRVSGEWRVASVTDAPPVSR